MVQIDRHVPIEFAILLEQEESESAFVAVFLFLTEHLPSSISTAEGTL